MTILGRVFIVLSLVALVRAVYLIAVDGDPNVIGAVAQGGAFMAALGLLFLCTGRRHE